MKSDWILIDDTVVMAIHEEQIAEHGGESGTRDLNLLKFALSRPLNHISYTLPADIDAASIAATYAYGVCKNHPFIDGNKRTGFVLLELSLKLNGWKLTAEDTACTTTMTDIASGRMNEAELTAWIRKHMQKTL